jgi:hypothetical protein
MTYYIYKVKCTMVLECIARDGILEIESSPIVPDAAGPDRSHREGG